MTADVPGSAVAADKRRALLHRLMVERGLARATSADGHPESTSIPRRPAGLVRVPQSFAQQRLWFLDRLAPGNPFYTVSLTIPIQAAVDVPALRRALDEVVRRHEALRTTFAEDGGQALQCVPPPAPCHLDVTDLRALTAAQRDAHLERIAREETSRSFDLERGPLVVARLVTLGPAEHRLLLTLHHIVCDGWSLRVLSRELVDLYTSFATGMPVTLPDLPIQYADFALWQREQLAGETLEGQLAYWREALSGAPELRLLPDRIRPAIPTFRGGLVALAITPADARAIARLGSETNATPFVVLLSAFMALLGRLTGQDDIVVGTPIANRTRPELEPLIGFFVNTLVLRADLRGDPSFRTVIGRVRNVALDAFANQDLPFERLVEELAPERVFGRNPLFQVIFQLFSAQDGVVGDASPTARQRGTAKFDLRLDLWPTRDGGYAGELEYSDDVFEAATAQHMARQFCTLLSNLLCAPDQALAAASAMDDDERRLVVHTVNATSAPYPDGVGIDALFREAALLRPEALALDFADAQLTYAQLDQQSDLMACRLAERGIRAGDAVAVLLDRSAAMIVAWLGVLKLGAAYIPLDIEQPRIRLRGMLEDARCRVVITAAGQLHLVEALDIEVERSDLHRHAPPVEWPAVHGDDIAHIIFTSGTTGRPKGVRIAHRGIARLTRGVDWVDFRPGDRVGQTSNPAFDASTYEVWSALLNGCTLIGIARETTLSAAALERQLVNDHIDHLFLTTALFSRLAGERPAMFAPLRSLMTGGAKAAVDVFRAVLDAGPPRRLFNAYGPTETTVLGAVWTAAALRDDAPTVPIGRPVTNTTCYVLDDHRRPVPIGAPGQLYIGGPGVSPGYVGFEALTAERFVTDPWHAGGMLYATGDRVRWRSDTQLEFLGRLDDQVKIRGFRVEPDEIAATLSMHPAIGNAVVVPRSRGDDDQGLVAYVELKDDFGSAFDTAAASGAADRLVEHWRKLYDTVLYDTRDASSTFNTSGWHETATGTPIPEADMVEQVGQTVDRMLATGAKRILEIGCGTGLLLFKAAPHCTRYVGTDLSAAAIDHVRRLVEAQPSLAHVELVTGPATDLSTVAPGSFDLVVLNSVVQYFPSFEYLVEVIQAAAARLAPGGCLYLGDLRHCGLLHAFHADILLQRAADELPVRALREELLRRVDEEQELALAPAALEFLRHRVPGFGPPRIELKRGWRRNELARFRYDALLRWQATPAAIVRATVVHWARDLGENLDALVHRLGTPAHRALRVQGIPNARVLGSQRCARAIAADSFDTVGALRADQSGIDAGRGVEPEKLWELSALIGWTVLLEWNADDDDAFDAVFLDPSLDSASIVTCAERRVEASLADVVTSPLRGHFARGLVPELKAHVAATLPGYMWPDHYVRLKRLPTSANGKIDKASLPAPERLRPELRQAYVGPRTETERRLATVWARLLDVDGPSVHDHFFNDVGGHSLLATQVISRIRSEFGVELPLRMIFEGPTIAELAVAIDAARANVSGLEPISGISGDPLGSLDIDRLDEAALDAALADLAAKGAS